MEKEVSKKIIYSLLTLSSLSFISLPFVFADNAQFSFWITEDIKYIPATDGGAGAVGTIYFNWDAVAAPKGCAFRRNGIAVWNSTSTTGRDIYGTVTGYARYPDGSDCRLFWDAWNDAKASVYAYTWLATTQIPNGPLLYSNFIPPANNYYVASDPLKSVSADKIQAVGEPINITNGNVSISKTDINIPDRELPLELSRTYNSQDYFPGQFGYGWRSNFDITLIPSPDSPDNGNVVEEDEQGLYSLYKRSPDGAYQLPLGKYSVLTKNPDGTYLLTRKHGKKLYFNPQGRLIKVEGRNANTVNITRSANGSILKVTASSGRTLDFTQDTSGRIIQVTDPAARVFKYDYDANGNLIRVTDPLGNQTNYQYNEYHNLTLETDANGHTLNFEYDPAFTGRAIHSWQDEKNNEVILSYDPYTWAPLLAFTKVKDSLGHTTTYEYGQANGLMDSITDSLGHEQLFNWGPNTTKTGVRDKNGNWELYTYDPRGNFTSIKNPLKEVTSFTYEPGFDFISSATDSLGNVTKYLYDDKGNLIQFTDALNQSANYAYNNLGQLIAITDPKNSVTTFTYHNYGNLASITDALNHTTLFTYDLLGNRTQIQDARGDLTQFTYNKLNQLTKITYPDGSTASYAYDALANRTSVTDNSQNTTTYAYNLNNQVTTITNPLGNIANFSYDTEGNRLSITDQNQNTTSYRYDSLNRLSSETNPLGLIKAYTYDNVGNVTSMLDAKNNKITYAYDVLNRLTKITYPDNSTVSFGYDSLGRRTSMTEARGTTNYTYDAQSQLTQVSGPEENSTLQYAYDALGNRTSLILPDGKTIQYAYDPLSRLTSITDSNNKVTSYTYDELGNLLNIDYPNNTQAIYSFDRLARLTQLTNQNRLTQEKLSEFIYTYDTAGRRVRVDSLDAVTDYTYDSQGELTGETRSSLQNPFQASYAYDPSGNRTRMLKNGAEHLYSYNALNQLTRENANGPAQKPISVIGTAVDERGIRSVTVNAATAVLDGNNFSCKIYLSNGPNTITVTAADLAGNTTSKTIPVTYNQTEQTLYLYDNNGNLIKKQSPDQTLNLSYDYENRLIEGTVPINESEGTVPFSYTYDPFGRRLSQTIDNKTTYYLYDGLDVVLEQNTSGDPVVSYLRNPYAAGGIAGIISSQPVKMGTVLEVGLSLFFYHYDGLGSVTNLSDTSGANIQSYSYDAFGNLLHQPAIPNSRQFLTKETDRIGLLYFGARYYDPAIGRFITPDPSGMSDGPNPYLYTLNDPVNFVDPYGLWYIDINFTGGYGIGGTGGIIIGPEGIYSYGGGGAVTPGISGSIMWSPQNPSSGWNVSGGGTLIIGGQRGYSFGNGGSNFWQIGIGSPGGSLTGYYVSKPWIWPWLRNKDQVKNKNCK